MIGQEKDPLREQVLAETYRTAADAGLELLAAIEALPLHYDLIEAEVWQFSRHVEGKGGQWTWRLRAAVTIGGYVSESRGENVLRRERRRLGFRAMGEARPNGDPT